MANVSVILPAAGSGDRFGAGRRKIIEPIGDRPVFLATLDAFAGRPDVCQIQLVVPPGDVEEISRTFGDRLAAAGAALVAGGATRSQSVRNALAGISAEAELVCVHDAVRPCVRGAWIDAVFAAAERTGAAILAWPVHATLKRVSGDHVISETVPREGLWEAQTPQVFRKDLLLAAYAAGADATDDADLMQSLGHPVCVVRGDPRNIKITTPTDLEFARRAMDSLADER